jgi:hypothetical protein
MQDGDLRMILKRGAMVQAKRCPVIHLKGLKLSLEPTARRRSSTASDSLGTEAAAPLHSLH